MSTTFSTATLVAFVLLTLVVAAVFVAGVAAASRGIGEDEAMVRRRRNVAGLAIGGWLAFSALVAGSGWLSHFDRLPPPLMIFVGLTVVTSTTLALSRFGGVLAQGLPVAALVGFHAFRLPLEIILHQLGNENAIPPQMTYHGMNFDVVTGVTAIAVALWAAAGTLPRVVLLLWNLLGLGLLLNIVTVAILSSPVPFRVFMNEPANTIIATAPFIWLPTVLVQFAWAGHLLIFRRLRP
jgi:hypothetical protein